MRTIPEGIAAAFAEQQGLNPIFMVEIHWNPPDDPIKYSTCEFEGQEIYAYVKEFSNFESVSHVEGLGSVSSIDIEFYDQFGHFKEIIDTYDIFHKDVKATVYLTIDGSEYLDLFEGRIADQPIWTNNTFTIQVLSKQFEKEIGYTPSIDDITDTDTNYDAYTRRLNSSDAWPVIFGQVKNYPIHAVMEQRFANVEADVPYSAAGEYYEIPISNIEDFTQDFTYLVNVVGNSNAAFSLLGSGQFTLNESDEPVFRLTKSTITSDWYEYIPFSVLDHTGFSETSDNPSTRILIAPGEFETDEFGTVTTTGPDGNPTLNPWIQFMKIGIRYTFGSGVTTITSTRYYNCVHQSGNICTLNEKINIPEGATEVYIRRASKSNDVVYNIPSGSKIYVLGDTVKYVIDTKNSTEALALTTLDSIQVQIGERLETISSSLYTVATTDLWDGTHPPCKHITMAAETYMRYLEFYTEQNQPIGEGILATSTSTIDTDAESIAEVSEFPVIDENPYSVNFAYLDEETAENVVPEIAWQSNKGLRFTRDLGVDKIELIDLTDNPTINLNDEPETYSDVISHTFTKYNVLQGSVIYTFSPQDNLYTVFRADFQTNDLLKELDTIRLKNNVAKYEEVVLDVDYYIFKNKSDAVSSLTFWRDKLSKYHYTINLVGFMDAFALEVWDRVAIKLDPQDFYDPTLGTPFTYVHTPSPKEWHALGRIRSIEPDLKEGTIQFSIELDTILGVSTTSSHIIR